MRLGHAVICVVLLTSCTVGSPTGPRELTASELCAELDGLRGEELWLRGPIDTTSAVLFRPNGGRPCAGTCCQTATYLYGFTCGGFGIVLYPESLDSMDGFLERSLETLLACFAPSDGTPSGGACRPDDCATLQARPNIADMEAFHGTLDAEPIVPSVTFFTDPTLPPLLLLRVSEVRWGPFEVPPGDAGPP